MQFNPEPPDYSHGLDASTIQPIESTRGIKYKDVQAIIPTDLDPNNPQGDLHRIANNAMKNAIESDGIKNSGIGRTAASVQQSMQTGASFGGDSADPSAVHHEIKVAGDPFQQQARINYSGLTHAQLSYHASESKMDFEVREAVRAISTDLVFNHTDIPGDRRDLVSLRWNW